MVAESISSCMRTCQAPAFALNTLVCEYYSTSLGYDIWYSDEHGKKHYVEVKGSTSENVEFVLTKNELEFAEQHAEEYEIWYVRIVDKQPTIPYELGNLLLLGEEETFFNNSKFAVENSEFRIRATANEQVEE